MNSSDRSVKNNPPFIVAKSRSAPRQTLDTRGMLSIATMFVSLTALSVSLFGAARLILEIFDDDPATLMEGIPVKVIVVAFSFIFGWIAALACIRGFGNLVYPILIKFYAWICLTALAILYLKVIQKLFLQAYDGMHFSAYLMILLGGLCVLISLHLLIEGHDLRKSSKLTKTNRVEALRGVDIRIDAGEMV
ncbi:MAG: hypothetical protein HGA28_04875, partial [Anaerolineaceae bacterium]|nr:hypothetical protein [Anaerolineaceae bacterium]